MPKLQNLAQKVRSKNAGPFWLTIDIFCGDAATYGQVAAKLTNAMVAKAFDTSDKTLKRFELPDLNVVKISLPRPEIQGSIADRDMHGASWAALLGELDL